MDNLGKAAFITRGTTKLLSLMTQRVPSPKQVNTREFRTHELNELDRVLEVIADQTDPKAINLSAKHGVQCQPGDMLYARDVYVAMDGNDVYFSDVFGKGLDGRYYIDQEPMLVIGVQRGAGPSSTDIVQVRRVAKGKGRTDFGGMIITEPNPTGTAGMLK
jgi:hypothetical protein